MKKDKYFLLLASLFVFTLINISCGGNSQKSEGSNKINNEKITITHLLGNINVNKNPQRVVVLDFSALENLDFIGVKPVAVPKSGLPAHLIKFRDDSSVMDVGSITEINIEKINEAQPDLIIIGHRLVDFYDQLSAIAPVLYPTPVDAVNFMEAFEKNIGDIAQLFDKQEEVDRAKADILSKIDKAKRIISSSDENALILLHNRGRFSAYGSGSRFGIIHDVLGISEAAEGLGVHRHGNPVSSEFIQKENPDIIFIIDRSRVVDKNETNKKEIENLLIKGTSAAKNGKIYYLNPEIWYLAGGGIASVNIMIDEVLQAF